MAILTTSLIPNTTGFSDEMLEKLMNDLDFTIKEDREVDSYSMSFESLLGADWLTRASVPYHGLICNEVKVVYFYLNAPEDLFRPLTVIHIPRLVLFNHTQPFPIELKNKFDPDNHTGTIVFHKEVFTDDRVKIRIAVENATFARF